MDEGAVQSRARRTMRFAPLDVWLRAMLISLLTAFAALGYFAFINPPLPSSVDDRQFSERIAELEIASDAIARGGQKPLKVVFIGTSRIKNVAFYPDIVQAAARSAGLGKPVVSSVLAINWGGFKRLEKAIGRVAEARPDYAIVMPELLYEDFAPRSRLKMAVRYVQQRFWGRSYAVFDVEREFRAPACSGFHNPPEERAQEHRSWMRTDVSAPGPMAAVSALRMLAAKGTKIYLAEIPTHPRLAALQTEKIPSDQVLALHALDAEANFEPFHSPVDVPTTAFCDFAHISPEQAGQWLRPLFGRIVADRENAVANTPEGSIRSAGTAEEAGLFLKSR